MTSEGEASVADGHVAAVGAGPGDPELLTLRGAALLERADVVFGLSEDEEMASFRDALLQHRGANTRVLGPDEYGDDPDALAVAKAWEGKRVVRLYAGDPLLGGQVDNLADACRAAGVEFELAPGLSAALTVPSYAGIPLMANNASETRLIDGSGDIAQLPGIERQDTTLVVLNAQGEGDDPFFDRVTKPLVAAGRPTTTPIAVVRMGTTTKQTTVVSTLGKLASALRSTDAKGHHVTRPATVIVGPGVRRQSDLTWFESRPLFGWRVLVPRTQAQAAGLTEQLRGYGAVPEQVPTISVEPPRTPQQMERAVRGLVNGRYQWVAFTSTNAVRAIRERVEEYELDARAFAGVRVAAVGEATADALRDFGIEPDLMPAPETQSSTGLVEVWPPYDPELDPIERVLLPRADIATETLSAGVQELGWAVDDVTAYRTVRAAPPPAPVREAIKGGGFDAVLFTSSSTVRNLVGIAGKPHAATVIAVIGRETEKTALEHGLRVDVVAERASVASLAEGLAAFGTKRRQEAIDAGKPVLRPSQKRRGRRRKTV
nr:uroporphyrinogen-III synthase [Spiractinospora alimapuensis]